MKHTIIIPTYNSSKFINIPLDSLEKQTYKDFEVLIINDGSTDELKKVIAKYLKRNPSWKLVNKKNGNWGSVINYAIGKNLIKGDYVSILDSDDWFEPQMLEVVSKRTEDIVVTGICVKENNKFKKMPVYFGKTKLIKKNRAFTPVSTPHGKFYKRELFQRANKLVEGVSYQDTILFNDLASKSKSIYYFKDTLAVWWRDRAGNSTNVKWDIKRANLWLETCQRIVNMPLANPEVNSYALMYLWELNRNYKGKIPFKVSINTKKAKFKWLPFGTRNLAKIWFKMKTKRYRK